MQYPLIYQKAYYQVHCWRILYSRYAYVQGADFFPPSVNPSIDFTTQKKREALHYARFTVRGSGKPECQKRATLKPHADMIIYTQPAIHLLADGYTNGCTAQS